MSEGTEYGLKLQVENKLKECEVFMLHSCMGTTLCTHVWFACIHYTQSSFPETLLIYTHTVYPQTSFLIGKRPEQERHKLLAYKKETCLQ